MKYFETQSGVLFQGDCLQIMSAIPDGAIDLILCDLPYGITDCEWDSLIPMEPLWNEYRRLIKQNGAIVLTAQQPFATDLINAARKWFRYEIIWSKAKPLGFLNANRMPLRAHENVLVFYKRLPCYNPQFTEGEPYHSKGRSNSKTAVYRDIKKRIDTINKGVRYPRSVLHFPQEGRTGHPTEKPQALFEWIVKTYTRPGETVLDNCVGSGTTAAACEATGRRWIGIEMTERFCEMVRDRLSDAPA